MLGFALCLAAAGRQPWWRPNRLVVGRPLLAVGIPLTLMTALVTIVSIEPSALGGSQPLAWEENVFDILSVATVLVLLVVIRTHWRRFHLGRDTVQLAIALSAAMSIAAIVAFEHGKFAQLSWWDYHAYLLAGFGGAVFAVFHRTRQEQTVIDVLGSAFTDDPFDHIVRGYPEALRSLVRAVEVKDAYTHGHSQRTARMAVELGLRMSLSPDRLRVIARGAYLHDLGKIGVPDGILNKPGRLTPAEREIIETHPRLGYELAASAPSLAEALPVILHHHERVDGDGYPDGLSGAAIPLEARVVAVADVWDALTSDRSYRKGWDPAEALAHIDAGRGTHFDPEVVDALVEVLGERGVGRPHEPGDAGFAWQAAQTCHEIDHAPELVGS